MVDKKILFIAMSDSIHTARWINQLVGEYKEIHLFPAIPNRPLHPLLKGKVKFHPFPIIKRGHGEGRIFNYIADYANRVLVHLMSPNSHVDSLIKLISKIKPDLIHSLEFQSAGYLVLKTKQSVKNIKFPKWLATNWGSDIFYFGKIKEQQIKIKALLSECNYYSCECQRDITLAEQYGFKGKSFLSTTNTGGYNLDWVKNNQESDLSNRKVIMLKGYQNWSGRALTVIEALENVGNLLSGYELVIYNINPPNKELIDRATNLAELNDAHVTIVPLNTSHNKILKLHGRARISIGLSISDALSTSAIEAMLMGSFPIQSNTSCIGIYLKDGLNGNLVPPEDVTILSLKLKEALTNDTLIKKAYEYNQLNVAPKFDFNKLNNETLNMYNSIFHDK